MQAYLILFLTLLFSVNSVQAERIQLYIKINNPSDQHVAFAYKKQANSSNSSLFRVDLNANNEVNFELQLEESKFIELQYAGKKIPLYIELQDELKIYFSGNDIVHSLRFEGKGAANNNVLAAYRKQFSSAAQKEYDVAYLKVQVDEAIARQAVHQKPASFALKMDAKKQQQLNFLQQNKTKLSSYLYNYLQTEINYNNATNKIACFLENPYTEPANSGVNVLKGIKLEDKTAFNHPAYTNFLKAYAFYQYLPNDLNRYKLQYPLYDLIEQQFTGQVKYYLQSELLVKTYNRSGDSDLAQKKFTTFATSCSYSEYTDHILAVYGGSLSGIEHLAAPDFDVVSPEGKLLSLSNYKGKVVYISLWASWCKPCIAGFKKSKMLRQQLQDMGVVLLNVSIDKSENAWRDALTRHQPLGINGLVLSLEDFSKKYDISYVPLYLIVDKNGKFAHLSQTEGRDIIDEFRRLATQ